MEFNLIGPSYVDDTKPFSIQDTINWIPESGEAGTRTQAILKTPRGLQEFSEVAQTGCRGLVVFQGLLYAVYDQRLYRIASNGTATEIGTLGGSGPVCFAANAHQLVIATGGALYVYDGATLSTASGVNSPNTCAFIDQYIVVDGDGGQFQISGLNEAGVFDPLDFATAESAPDDTIAVLVDHQELLIGGTETIEVWVNTGDADFPFARTQGSLIERGIGAPHTWRKMDNSNVWVDNLGMVQLMSGHSPQRISTHPIEQEIDRHRENLSDLYAWTYTDRGHWFYVLQLPELGKTFVWDANTKLWHRRRSYEVDYWRARYWAYAYGKHIVGDLGTGIIWDMAEGVYMEGDDPLVSERYTAYASGEDQWIFNHSVWLKFDTGHGTVSGQGANPMVDMRWSDDGGYNFNDFWTRSIGLTGERNKDVRFHGLGRFKDRVFHIRVTDPVKRDLLTAYIRSTQGFNA